MAQCTERQMMLRVNSEALEKASNRLRFPWDSISKLNKKMMASAGNGILRSYLLTPRPKPKPFVPRPFLQMTPKPKSTLVIPRMSYNSDPTPTPATDRLISVVSYTLPFFNSLHYGRYLFLQFPNLGLIFDPILPLVSLYRSIPYSSFVAFFALYLGVVRNSSFSRYVRFNSMQAVTLDVLLVLPLLLQRIFTPGRSGLGFRLMVSAHNLLFLFTLVCFLYSVASCVLGRTPHLPFVADAASRQL